MGTQPAATMISQSLVSASLAWTNMPRRRCEADQHAQDRVDPNQRGILGPGRTACWPAP